MRTLPAFGLGILVTAAAFAGVAACTDPGMEEPPVPVPAPEVESVEPEIPEDYRPSFDEHRAAFESDGLVVGDVILCDAGWTVSVDEYNDGITWAACM